MESWLFSLMKTLSYRFFGSLLTLLVGLFITQSFQTSLLIGILDFIAKSTLYFIHERLWNKIHVMFIKEERNDTEW